MKQRITMHRLMQEGWIPLLTGILSAGVILSLAHSTGMGYVAALMLMTLYFVVISAGRVAAISAVLLENLQRQAFSKIKASFLGKVPGNWRRNFLSLPLSGIAWPHRPIHRDTRALLDRVGCRASWIESVAPMLSRVSNDLCHGSPVSWFRNQLATIDRFLRAVKRAV